METQKLPNCDPKSLVVGNNNEMRRVLNRVITGAARRIHNPADVGNAFDGLRIGGRSFVSLPSAPAVV